MACFWLLAGLKKMMSKLKIVFVLVLIAFKGFSVTSNDVTDEMSRYIKAGDTKQLATYFSSSISIALRNDEGVYSRGQAEIVLREFFKRNSPKEITLIHRIDSNPNFRYVVLDLLTDGGSYRLSYKMVSEANKYKITELRIE